MWFKYVRYVCCHMEDTCASRGFTIYIGSLLLSHFAMTTVTCGKAFPEKGTEDADTSIFVVYPNQTAISL